MRASFVYHQITAVLSIIATILIAFDLIKNNNSITVSQVSMNIALLAITWGVHAIIHFLEEYFFDFEPLSGSSKVRNRPIR